MATDHKFKVKNGLHTQNIEFVDSNNTHSITASMLTTDTLSFSGGAGQLFSLTDSMSGTIFSVNDVSGIPSIEVDDDGTIRLAETSGNILIGTGTDDGSTKLQVDGSIKVTGFTTSGQLDVGTQNIKIGNNYIYASGDSNSIHVNAVTSFIPNSTTTANNPDLGLSGYRWKSIYGGLINGTSFALSNGWTISEQSGGYARFSSWVNFEGQGFYTNSAFYVDLDSSSSKFAVRGTSNQELFKIDVGNGNKGTFNTSVDVTGVVTVTGNNWYQFGPGSMGASVGSYGMGNKNSSSARELTFHVPNIAAYSNSGTIPSFGWYSNGADNLMTLESASGDLAAKGTLELQKDETATGDVLSLYGNRLGTTTMYGFGLSNATLYHKAHTRHQFYNGTNYDNSSYDVQIDSNHLQLNDIGLKVTSLEVLDTSRNLKNLGNITANGNAFVFGSASQTQAQMYLRAQNTAGAPARATAFNFEGYESRAQGLFFTDSGQANKEWFAGIPYNASFGRFSIGYHNNASSQPEYTANEIFSVDTSNNVRIDNTIFLSTSSNYHQIRGRDGNTAIYLGGSGTGADNRNYYDSAHHRWRTDNGAVNLGEWSQTGLHIGGITTPSDKLEVTGNASIGDASNIAMSSASAGQLKIKGNGYTGAIALDGSAMHIYHNSSSRDLVLGTNETARLTIGGGGSSTFSGTVTVDNTAPVVILNDTDATNNTNQIGYVSFRRGGTENAYVGYGSSSTDLFYVAGVANVALRAAGVNQLIASSTGVTIAGDLTVNGTTTTIDTANLNVEDNNITLNYSTGDSSSTADGAGITIQDAVNSSSNASMTWNATGDHFQFSHGATFGVNTVDPDSYSGTAGGFGNIADGGGWGARGVYVHGGGTGDAAAMAHNGSRLYFGIQNGSSANSMATWLDVQPNKQTTFAAQINTASHGNSSQWNAAYGWGDHGSAGYITSVTAGAGLTGGGSSGAVTLAMDWTTSDTFTGTYGLVWNASNVPYTASWLQVRGSDDTLLTRNITATGNIISDGLEIQDGAGLRLNGGYRSDTIEGTYYNWFQSGAGTDTSTWWKVCDVTISTGLYKALAMHIRLKSQYGNYGSTEQVVFSDYTALFPRSGGTQDDAGTPRLTGYDTANHELRIYKTGNGVYQLQSRMKQNYRDLIAEIQVLSTNGGSVTVPSSGTAGTTSGGTAYTAVAPSTTTSPEYYMGKTKVSELKQGDNTIVDTIGRIYSGNNGSTSSPSISRGTDPDTGFYFPTGNEIGIVTGAGERVRISNNSVQIGNTSGDRDARLTVHGTGTGPNLSSTTPSGYTAVFGNSDANYGTLFATDGTGRGYIQQRRTNNATTYPLILQPYGSGVGFNTGGSAPNHFYDFVLPSSADNLVIRQSGQSFTTASSGITGLALRNTGTSANYNIFEAQTGSGSAFQIRNNGDARILRDVIVNSMIAIDSGLNHKIASGSNTAPGLRFYVDENTGLFRQYEGVVSFTSDGTNVLDVGKYLKQPYGYTFQFPASTQGWRKLAKIDSRGGGRLVISFTGGNFAPNTYVIDYFKNWSTTCNLKLEQYGTETYITKARLRTDSSDSKTYLEIYLNNTSSNSDNSIYVFDQRLLGYNSTTTVYTGALSAGSSSGNTHAEMDFLPQGSTFNKLDVEGTTTLARPVLINGANDNSGKADFGVDVGGNPQISWSGNQVNIGGTDMNWAGKILHDGTFRMGAWNSDINFFSQSSSGSPSRDVYFSPQATGGTNTERVRIKGDTGRVGIGTNAPSAVLSLLDPDLTTTGEGLAGLRVHRPNAASQYGYVDYDYGGGGINIGSLYSGGGNSVYGTFFFKQHNAAGSQVAMFIDNVGKVGIGTVNPQNPLEILTSNKLGTSFTGGTDGEGIRISQSTYTNGNNISLIEASHASSSSTPDVRIGAMFTGSGSTLKFGTSNNYGTGITNTAMVITPLGTVGINRTSPNEGSKLHVGGSVRISSAASDQNTSADTGTIPATSGADVLRLEGNYTNGQYTTEFAKIDRSGNLPLYIRESRGTANSFTNIMRIGGHGQTDGSYTAEVFGALKVAGDILSTGNEHYFVSTNNYIQVDQNTGTRFRFHLNGAKQAEIIRVSGAHGQIAVDQFSTGSTADGYPAFTEMGDTDTGVYFNGDNQVGFTTGGNSRLICQNSNDVIIGGFPSYNHYDSTSSARLSFGGGNDFNNYSIGTSMENVGGNYTKLDLRWHTGIRMGAQATYGGIRFFNNEDFSTMIFSIGRGDAHIRVESGSNLYLEQGELVVNGRNTTLGTANFIAHSNKGANESHIHYGSTGDWYIRSSSTGGKVVLQDSGGNVGIGTSSPQKPLDVITPNNDFVSFARTISTSNWAGIHFGYRENNNSYRKSAIVFERTDLTENNAQGKVHILNGPQSGAGNCTLSDAALTIRENGAVVLPKSVLEFENGSNTITASMLSSDTLSFSGDSGQLFSLTDSMSGTIFSVNDVSGIPSIEVEDDGTIYLAESTGNVLIGTGTDNGNDKLQLTGDATVTGHVGVDVAANASYSLYVGGHIAQSAGSIYAFGDVVIGNGELKRGTTTLINSSRQLVNLTFSGDTTGVRFARDINLLDTGNVKRLRFNSTGSSVYNSTNGHFFQNGGTNKAEIQTDGDAIFAGNVTAYGSPSDINLKENIETIPNAVEKVQKLDGVTFNYKKDGGRSTGLIAQQLQEVLPEVVYTTKDLEGEEHLAVRYGNVVGLLVEAIKEQQTQLTAQQEQINQLTNLVNKLMEK